MRIAIVNDVGMVSEALRRIVVSDPGHEVIWTAANGREALVNSLRERPELILMDLLMPVMDGLEATRQIMKQAPCPILLVTAHLSSQTGKVFEALGAGAIDVIATPQLGGGSGAADLLAKIRMIRSLVQPAADRCVPSAPSAKTVLRQSSASDEPMVVLGASAGGPVALGVVLGSLPKELRASVVIVQHIDEQFAPGLAFWLNSQSSLPVRIISNGDRIERGVVFLAATNDHLVLSDAEHFAYTPEPLEVPYRPSVDVFFRSVARYRSGGIVAALLTGIGRDGAAGLLTLRSAGALTIAQDEQTSTVYGMPKAARQIDAAERILPLDQIGPAIAAAVRLPSRPGSRL